MLLVFVLHFVNKVKSKPSNGTERVQVHCASDAIFYSPNNKSRIGSQKASHELVMPYVFQLLLQMLLLLLFWVN